MWIKLSDSEVIKIRTAKARSTAKYTAILLPLTVSVTQKIGYNRHKSISSWDPITWYELFSSTHGYILAGILIYTIIIYSKKDYKAIGGTRFCTTCEKHYDNPGLQKCTCGGDIDFLELYKYVYDKHST